MNATNFWPDQFYIISRFGLRHIQQEDTENQWRDCKMLGGFCTKLYIIAQMVKMWVFTIKIAMLRHCAVCPLSNITQAYTRDRRSYQVAKSQISIPYVTNNLEFLYFILHLNLVLWERSLLDKIVLWNTFIMVFFLFGNCCHMSTANRSKASMYSYDLIRLDSYPLL